MSTLNRSPINISNNPSLLASPIAIATVLKNLEKFNVDESYINLPDSFL